MASCALSRINWLFGVTPPDFCPFTSQFPNYLAWDEDQCGIPAHLLHVGCLQWFWDKVITLPSKEDSNLLLLQADVDDVASHLLAWMHQSPSIALVAGSSTTAAGPTDDAATGGSV